MLWQGEGNVQRYKGTGQVIGLDADIQQTTASSYQPVT